jgi:hypothetical protein
MESQRLICEYANCSSLEVLSHLQEDSSSSPFSILLLGSGKQMLIAFGSQPSTFQKSLSTGVTGKRQSY